MYISPTSIRDISQGIAKALGSTVERSLEMEVQAADPHNSPPVIFCRWDFCGQTFVTYIEWETHFAVEHIAYEKAQDLSGRKRRQRSDGHWEIVENEFSLRHHLPIDLNPTQGTGDTTMTSHTLSLPVPPPFDTDLPMSMPTHVILPPRSSPEVDNHDNANQSHEDEFLVPAADHDAQIAQLHFQHKNSQGTNDSQNSALMTGASSDPRLRDTPSPPGAVSLFMSPLSRAQSPFPLAQVAPTQISPSHPSYVLVPESSGPDIAEKDSSRSFRRTFTGSFQGNPNEPSSSAESRQGHPPSGQPTKTPTSSAESAHNQLASSSPNRRISLTFGSAKVLDNADQREVAAVQDKGMGKGGVKFGFGQSK
ncbi:conserved hypothetical protein [Cryptococcus deneoformans JEC21]|uniref:Uncharacterized protein n=1 Tax=Cryptococcus deneoformans (strain JEC21 / ATCC MYA-565) TaxID=214684 RepID=Q5KAC7_CRYD1|nr:conserved hypothetical protein [Cryptococcus neoformans var. neoformans JEC21]AAW45919.2 conserved hypothetical protein [Cryptococcus neoformans var. neoformans JEC21]